MLQSAMICYSQQILQLTAMPSKNYRTIILLSVLLSMTILAVAGDAFSASPLNLSHFSTEPYAKNLSEFVPIIQKQLSIIRNLLNNCGPSSSPDLEKLRVQISALNNDLSICNSLLEAGEQKLSPTSCSTFEQQIEQLRRQNSALHTINSKLSLEVATLQSNQSVLINSNSNLLKENKALEQKLSKAEQKQSPQCENVREQVIPSQVIEELQGDLDTCNVRIEVLQNQVIQIEQNFRNQEQGLLNSQLLQWTADLRQQFSIIVREVNATLKANNISKLDFTQILNTLQHIEHLHEERQFATFKEASEAYRGAVRDLSSQLVELTNTAAATHSQEIGELKKSKKEVVRKFEEVLQKLRECNQALSRRRT